ncbi:transglycosylase SLT domain-containing protein [uncultured Streptomyces sp.]|uniref:transglycosylase SLT domain-containing protein n=1 Tax=uncultured Streptomyces sp. TaxID=174707 RepID=UPI0026181EEC|nr:transglycosylase SLT domain-containing protein [uncultured Streptomyces sp.]
MSASSNSGYRRLNKAQKLSVAGVSALGAAALALTLVPAGNADAESAPQAVSAEAVAFDAAGSAQAKTLQNSTIEKNSTAEQLVKAADAVKAKAAAEKKEALADAQAVADAKVKSKAVEAAKAKKAAAAKAAEVKKAAAANERSEVKTASRSAARTPVYADNLHGWISEALSIMKKEGIPGTYEGLHRNIMRESSGNPNAINDWDINAQNGVPSIGLLQIIKPTFDYYHVPGTPHTQYDPVANLTAAANYAADKYGSIDNVDSAY